MRTKRTTNGTFNARTATTEGKMNLVDLDEIINALLADSAAQRKRMADFERRIRELERAKEKAK